MERKVFEVAQQLARSPEYAIFLLSEYEILLMMGRKSSGGR